MDLDWLKNFIALAQHGDFSRAADTRRVAQGGDTSDVQVEIRLMRSPDCCNAAADALWERPTSTAA